MTRDLSGRRGFALITVVLLMIGLAVLATGLLFSAAQQASIAANVHDVIRARLGADAGVALALGRWDAVQRALDPERVPVGLVEPTPLAAGVLASARGERIGPELYLVTGLGRAERPGLALVEQRSARLVGSRDLVALGALFDAAVIAGSIGLHGGSQAAGDEVGPGATSAGGALLCAQWPGAGAGVRGDADSVTVEPGAAIRGVPALLPDAGAAGRMLDDPAVTGLEPGVPAVPGDLVLLGGEHDGILIVDGDLSLDGGARFRGVLVVKGTLVVRDARVEGSLVARRVVMQGGRATLDRCAIADALVGSPSLAVPSLPARSWLPVFEGS